MFQPKNHDLALPDWGPYSKRYAGVSHITDRRLGLRFDCSVFPALYRRRADVPSVNWETSWHSWDCAPDLEYFSFRHELIWKDQLYADIAYMACPESHGVLIRCEFVNATDRAIPVSLHTAASLQFPSASPSGHEPLRRVRPHITNGSFILIHPVDYEELQFGSPKPGDSLVADGLFHGEIRLSETLDGSALGGRFGRVPGDCVRYCFRVDVPISDPILVVRMKGQGSLCFCGAASGTVKFSHQNVENLTLALDPLERGEHKLEIQATAEDFTLIALAIHAKDAGNLDFSLPEFVPRPKMHSLDGGGSGANPGPRVLLKYPDAELSYGITWHSRHYDIREILHDEIDSFLRHHAHNHVDRVLRGNDLGHFTNIHLRPLSLAPGSRTEIWGLVCAGDPACVEQALSAFADATGENGQTSRTALYQAARSKAFAFAPNPAGASFAFSQSRMAATTLSNIVFPVYAQRQNIRHRPPGRWWNSLYTWDSGFIGLGLVEISPEQAWQNLDQYLTDAGNPHAAFLHHGSMVPMQVHLYHELWNRTGDTSRLKALYPSVRALYHFHAGHSEGSSTRNLRSGLLRTWDYFYNSGGWDDYPPQAHVHRQSLQQCVTPTINTAQAIRCAKSLRLAATALEERADAALYEADIAFLSRALEDHSWDEASGCYSYVVHDEDGEPSHPLRHTSGRNYNLGLDGLYPLIAGICPPERCSRLERWLFDPQRLWTPYGITAVDQTAPYYRADGYWSGTVWFAHQWFLWKTMLDLGRSRAAFQIAATALATWRAEVDDSYHCFEHFHGETGRGCGWHQFSGLSTPVMIFYAACYCPGKLTVGFDAWVVRSQFSPDQTAFTGEILFVPDALNPDARRTVWVCLQAGPSYRATWDGAMVPITELTPGLLSVDLRPLPGHRSAVLAIRGQGGDPWKFRS